MKLGKLILSSLLASAALASAGTVIIQLSSGTSTIATGFADASSSAASGLVWGLIISNGDTVFTDITPGFQLAVTTNTGTNGTQIGTSNDWYFGSSVLTSTQATGTEAGALGKIGSLGSINLGTGAVTGSRFAVVWFDRGITAPESTIPGGTKYGLLTDSTFLVPASGVTSNLSGFFAAANDPIKPANTVTVASAVPEPSAALLGAVGVLGLLRRRRI